MVNFERLENLKLMLSHEQDLDKVWSYFMTHFADHEAFTDVGEAIRNPLVEKIVVAVSKQLFKRGKVKKVLLIYLSDFNFLHGVFRVGKRNGGIIYFEEIQKGMIAVSDNPPSKLVKYSRFTAQPFGSSQNFN